MKYIELKNLARKAFPCKIFQGKNFLARSFKENNSLQDLSRNAFFLDQGSSDIKQVYFHIDTYCKAWSEAFVRCFEHFQVPKKIEQLNITAISVEFVQYLINTYLKLIQNFFIRLFLLQKVPDYYKGERFQSAHFSRKCARLLQSQVFFVRSPPDTTAAAVAHHAIRGRPNLFCQTTDLTLNGPLFEQTWL